MKMVFHHWESNFTPKEKWFYTLLPTKQCKIENREKQFSGKTFYVLPNGALVIIVIVTQTPSFILEMGCCVVPDTTLYLILHFKLKT